MHRLFRSRIFDGTLIEASDFFATFKSSLKASVKRFEGAGVYALYYFGEYDLYHHCRSDNEGNEYPIYIGKAVPKGSRRGVNPDTSDSCYALWGRLNEHYRSIGHATNISTEEFRFKAMVMHYPEADLISAVESHLIRLYRPIWNSVVDGFGNHTPGKGRFEQAKSDWDVIHPGRPFAEKCLGIPNSYESIRKNISEWTRSDLSS